MARENEEGFVEEFVDGEMPEPKEEVVEEPEEEETVEQEEPEDEPVETEEEEETEEDRELLMRDRVFRERRIAAEREAESEAKEYEFETRRLQMEKELYETRAENVESKIEKVKAKLEEMEEKGETKGKAGLTEELFSLTIAKRESENAKKKAEADLTERGKYKPNPAELAYRKLNPWFDDKQKYRDAKYDKMRQKLIALDKQLNKEGSHDPFTHDYFRELDKRFRANAPEMKRSVPKGAVSRSSPGGGKATASSSLAARMEALGMDPTNKEHVARWHRAQKEHGKRN